MNILHSVWLGIHRRPLRYFAEMLLAYSALWTVVESVSAFFPDTQFQGAKYYAILIGLCIIISTIRAYPKRTILLNVGHSNTTIRIAFDDIFQQDGYIAIPANEFFDSELGLPVSPKSLHGMVIKHYFGGHQPAFDQLIDAELAGESSQNISRKGGKSKKYDIGTTALINTTSKNFLLFALCFTDIETYKASAGLPELARSIQGLCAKARLVLGGDRLVIPLVGSGLSGIGLPAQHLLQMILLTIVDETKKEQFALEIDIILHPSRFDEINLSLIKDIWR